jgi:hypothetical protein
VRTRNLLRRWHIWLGWIVGVPMLLWTATGLFMAAAPIETVRGEHLVSEPPVLSIGAPPVAPAIGPRPVTSLSLEPRPGGARWIVKYKDGGARLADPATGRLLPPLTAADARAIVEDRYAGTAKIAAVDRTAAAAPPIDLRREVDAWRVSFDDGTRFYLDARTGEILARRTRLWRAYDFMWGLHILDPVGRTDFNHFWLISFALVSLVSILMAIALLPMARRRHK